MAEKDLDLSFMPHMLEGDKKFIVGGGRVTGKKKLDDEDELEAYADLIGMMGESIDPKLMAARYGGKYRKKLSPDSSIEFYGEKSKKGMGEPWTAGVNYRKEFKKGGAVKSASSRADGCAQRGKTKGRMV
jgi:hypothetical protein